MKEETLTAIRTAIFAVAGLACAFYVLSALSGSASGLALSWLPPLAGVCVAVLIFGVTFYAGRNSAEAAYDEQYAATNRSAASAGFWAAIVLGSAVLFTGIAAPYQLAITLSGAAGTYFLAHVLFELRGRL